MKNCNKGNKVYATIVFLVAIVLCILVSQHSFDASMIVIPLSRFIEVLIPILGVAALIKYIACGGQSSSNDDSSCNK